MEKGWDPLKTGSFELAYPIQFVPDPDGAADHPAYDIRRNEEGIWIVMF